MIRAGAEADGIALAEANPNPKPDSKFPKSITLTLIALAEADSIDRLEEILAEMPEGNEKEAARFRIAVATQHAKRAADVARDAIDAAVVQERGRTHMPYIPP